RSSRPVSRSTGSRARRRRAARRLLSPVIVMPRAARRRIITNPVESARQARLTYVTEGRPGLRRHRAGLGFVYRAAAGRRVRDGATLARIRALAIPPAWNEVWIAPSPHGHIQALGRDARGRKQYRYHDIPPVQGINPETRETEER